jgi:cytidine deaminase
MTVRTGTRWQDPFKQTPMLDPASIGVSFVDILFALAVGQVFSPVAQWAQDPKKNPLPLLNWLQLAVALTITITSWIGYHASANKARFRPDFVNVELLKLVLDILMVAVYFMLAAYAVHKPVDQNPETLLVLIAFLLYAGWDGASIWQKRPGSHNPYRQVWNAEKARRPDLGDWGSTDWGRVKATRIALFLVGAIWVLTWFGPWRLTFEGSVIVDAGLLFCLVGYRLLKVWWTMDIPRVSPEDWLKLEKRAKDAARQAYAPYSGFSVGAAVLTREGRIFDGCNVENASYGLTICAERNAIFTAVAEATGTPAILAIYIIAQRAGDREAELPGSPCGACRQVIYEFGRDAIVSYISSAGRRLVGIEELLPDAFVISSGERPTPAA